MSNDAPRLRPVEILMVEDSPTDALLTREALAYAKVLNRLHVVEDGVAALDFLNRRGPYRDAPRPDVVILDLNLPKKSGREVLAEVKEDPGLKAIPIVVLTTSRDEQDVIRSYKLHANCYIAKPVDFEAFAQIVRSIESFWFTVVTLPPPE